MEINRILGYNDGDLTMLVGNGNFLMPVPTSEFWDEIFPSRHSLVYIRKSTFKEDFLNQEGFVCHEEMRQRNRECGIFD